MPSTVNLKALGLNYSPNALSLPEGSLLLADDVFIRRDGVIESRRGMREYTDIISDTYIKQTMKYKNRLIAHYGTTLKFDTGNVDNLGKALFSTFQGSFQETQDGLRLKYIEANKNLYFTTSTGIKRISAVTADDFSTASGYIRNAGAVKALDISAELVIEQGQISGFLPPDTAVAYRAVWGYLDANQNLILGTPSNSVPIYNYLSNIIPMDLNALCLMLDILNQSTSLITDGNYAQTFLSTSGTSSLQLQENVLNLATKIDQDLLFGNTTGAGVPLTISTIAVTNTLVTVTFSAGNPSLYMSVGDFVEIKGVATAGLTITNGNWELTSVTGTTLGFIIPDNTTTVAAAAPGASTQVFSYNYRHITNTDDDSYIYPTALNNLTLSIPATNRELSIIEHAIGQISLRLKIELPAVIPTALQTAYVTPYSLTQAANTELTIEIPSGIDSSYFVQLYRSLNFTAQGIQTLGGIAGIPVVPDDELHLVFEYFPTATDLSNGYIKFTDNYPEELVVNNTSLYTNPVTGQGILQANDIPPFAKDISQFKNVVFYGNTKTKYTMPTFQLLGLSNITSGDKITISDGTTLGTQTYTFVDGVEQVTDITCTAAAAIATSSYFILYTPSGAKVTFWYQKDGVGAQPVVAGTDNYIRINILTGYTASQVAQRTLDTINTLIYDFSVVTNTLPKIRVTNVNEGITTAPSAGTSGFTITVITPGNGEDAATLKILKANEISAAQSIDLSAKSLSRVINKQTNSPVYAYYISNDISQPGIIYLQSKSIGDRPFYVLGSNTAVGESFNPIISPDFTNITNISTGSSTVTITTSAPHGLINQDQIMLTNTNSTPIVDGIYSVTVTGTNTFTIVPPATVTVAGSQGSWSNLEDVAVASNEVKPNRIYYSKLLQPDAVPLLNYMDVGAEDKAILRIYPLRTSLFVLKEDGVYRISGETAPFVTQLFDTSCILIAPDSVSLLNNEIYGWTRKGITKITEGGTEEVSRPIDTVILALASSIYSNFSKLTWGVGYESDSSYTVYTNTSTDDTEAQIGFRYCSLTNTWTNIQRSQTCGVILDSDDKLYMGSGEMLIHQERKDFNRTDYADKDFLIELQNNGLSNNGMNLALVSVDGISEGDVLTQDQTVTLYIFNQLLRKLDNDTTVNQKNYLSTLQALPGSNMRTKLVALATKLDLDTGLSFSDYSARIANKTGTILSNGIGAETVVTTSAAHGLIPGRVITISGTQTPASNPAITGTKIVSATGTFGSSTTFKIPETVTTSGGTGLTFSTTANLESFDDIKACFNEITSRLNSDPGTTYKNYTTVTETTAFEAVITSVNPILKEITVNLPLQWIVGDMTIFNAIPCEIIYAPATFGDPLSTKQLYEATVMFSNRAFTEAIVSFSSDLKPEFIDVPFSSQGNGIFGHYAQPGFGYGFFGGASNAAPLRTYVPRQVQRCRFVNVRFAHKVARELWALYGITLTGNVAISTRGYR